MIFKFENPSNYRIKKIYVYYDYIIEKNFAAFEIKTLINYKFDSFSNNNAGGIIINNSFLINNIFYFLNRLLII